MDLDGFVGSKSRRAPSQLSSSPEAKPMILGYRLLKQERSSAFRQDEWRTSKAPRIDDFSAPKTMPLHPSTPFLRYNPMISGDSRQQQQMLSFSSLKPRITSFSRKDGGLVERSVQSQTGFPYYQQYTPSDYTRSAGYGTTSLNACMHRPFTVVRSPFTPSQLMELKLQALIYKYFTANVPVPSNLLISLKNSFNPYALSSTSSTGSFPPNPLGWSPYYIGYQSKATDTEPGRCRRTDGKKWRCARDVVYNQKYCERHMNRGRNRSRKPVEDQPGWAPTRTADSHVAPMSTSMSTNRAQELQGDSMMSSSAFTIPKQDIPFEASSHSEFGLFPSDSFLNPSERSSINHESFLNFNDQETPDQHPFYQFIDDWPKNDQSSRSVICWSEELESDWTQLSISIPMASSSTLDKLSLSPLRLSRDFDPVQMGLGVSSDPGESSPKQINNWTPISLGASRGDDPLGEALTNCTGNVSSCKRSSSTLNLLTEGWDDKPQLGPSPTGVLQKAAFDDSLSHGSSDGSLKAESNDEASPCNDVLGSTNVEEK